MGCHALLQTIFLIQGLTRVSTTSAMWETLHKHNTPYSSTSPTVTGTEGKDSITTCPSTRVQGLGLWLQQTWEAGLVRSPHRATEQTTHRLENNYIKEVLALLQKF